MEDKQKSSTPEVPKSSGGKRKSRKADYENMNKGGKTKVVVVTFYTSSNEELKHYKFTTGSNLNKTILKSSREKFLGYATTKFGNDVIFSLAKRRTTLMHTQPPSVVNHLTATSYKQMQHGIEGKKWRKEFLKLQNDLGSYMEYCCGTNVIQV